MELTQEQLREALQEKAIRVNQEAYRYFEPNGKSEEFINTVGNGKYFVTLFSAANGVGKTTTASNILANLFWPCGNKFFQQPFILNWPYIKRGRIVSDPTNVDGIIRELKKWFPAGRYKPHKGRKPYEANWKTDTGWEFDIMTYDQLPKEFEGANLGFVWFDEPPPESIYKACIARLRKGGLAFISATPLAGSEWMYDQIISNPDNDKGLRTYIEATVEDACKQHGIRGHLEHENIEKIVAQYSEDDKQARVYGKFQHLTGLIFKRFSRKIHVIKPFLIDFKDYTVYQFLDPHPRNPDAVMWGAVDRFGRKYIIDELYLKCEGGTEELAQRIKQKDSQYRIVEWHADPSAFIEDQHAQKSLATRLSEYGLHYIPATKARTMSDRRIEDALAYHEVNGEMIKAPELYIFENCLRTVWEFEHYRWDEWTGRSADKHSPKPKPLDKDDHMIEDIGRFLFREPTFIPYIEQSSQDYRINFDPYAN